MEFRYFDNNATTALHPDARAAWLKAQEELWLNPSSPYRAAAAVRVQLESLRQALSSRLGVEPHRIIFNSGATEGNNAVIRHLAKQLPRDMSIGISATEHPSVIESAKAFLGDRVHWLDLDRDGRVDLDALGDLLALKRISAVSVMAANNETGVIQPWQAIASVCRAAGIPFHCDASQWVGKMPMEGLADCSYVTACAHKFGGPKGVGFLILPRAGDGCHLLWGGEQESGHRSGTEDVASILAMSAALEAAVPGGDALRDEPIAQIRAAIPGVVVVGENAPRLWNTVSLLMPEYRSERWIRGLEKLGFLLSAGSACSTGKSGASHVLVAMGIEPTAAARVLRVSASASTSAEDWAALAGAMAAVYASLQDEASGSSSRVISID